MDASLPAAGRVSLRCTRCGAARDIEAGAWRSPDGAAERCPLCDCRELFVRKDFPQRLGMALVVVFALAASVFYYFERIPATFATLASLAVIDAVIYLFVGKVIVCYRCRAELRGPVYNPRHEPFDLATSEKYG